MPQIEYSHKYFQNGEVWMILVTKMGTQLDMLVQNNIGVNHHPHKKWGLT